LNQAFLLNPDFIVFVDDDEYVTPGWVNELLVTITNSDADAVRGPVIAKLDENTSKYIAYFFRRKEHPDNSQIYSFATGNLILRRKSLEKLNVWFDNRFNYTGSEDSFFGIQLMKKGAKIFWAAKAIVYETIPEKRANLKWLIRRYYNGALTYAYILKLERKYFRIIKKTIYSGAYFLIGITALPILIFPFRWKYWGILKISEAIGGFAGLFSILFHEYAKDR
jgi:GT2 family glycosyltransferase